MLDLTSPQVSAALIAAVVSLIIGCVTALVTVGFAERKLRRDYKLEFAAERIAHEMLMDKTWRLRTFEMIAHHLAGFEDNVLRQILVRAGAIRFESEDGIEFWGLLKRNRDRLGMRRIRVKPQWRYSGPDEVLPSSTKPKSHDHQTPPTS